MSSDPSNPDSIVVAIRGLAKAYTIAQNTVSHGNLGQALHTTLSEALIYKLKHPLQRPQTEILWALQDISFQVACGDVIGIIGRNGAGKSTLLKILSGITGLTAGEIDIYGRVGSLLEIGAGFHGELTGRENIYLNGALIGMTRHEIARHFDAIVDFAGVERFLDVPVKRYSSGMSVRLGFAVAAHLSAEIMIIDEVLAVGDVEFQEKCLSKIREVGRSGRTVFFVSHHMESIASLCNRALFLEQGRVTYLGSVTEAIAQYKNSFKDALASLDEAPRRSGSGEFRVVSVTPAQENFGCSEAKVISFTVRQFKPFWGKIFFSCSIINSQGELLLECDSRRIGCGVQATEHYAGQFILKTPWLNPGDYRIDICLYSEDIMDKVEQACYLHVLAAPTPLNTHYCAETSYGTVLADFDYV